MNTAGIRRTPGHVSSACGQQMPNHCLLVFMLVRGRGPGIHLFITVTLPVPGSFLGALTPWYFLSAQAGPGVTLP